MTFKSFETVIKSLIEHYEKDQDKCYDTETNELTCELCLIWQDFKANHNNLRILCGYFVEKGSSGGCNELSRSFS